MMESDSINVTPHGGGNGRQRMRTSHGRASGPTRRSTKGQWTAKEDELLCEAVQRFNGKNWKKIAECFKDRTDVQCLHRWQKVLNPELVKGPWTKEEDDAMVVLVKKYGAKKWSTIANHLPGRIGKQCRERWHNHLNPSINKEAWTQEEELMLIQAHQIYGNKWAELTKYLPGRSDNSIKNHWNSSVKKKVDSYLASGLLAQFQGLPHVSETNLTMPSPSSAVRQSSGDGSVLRDVETETEEISEYSQGCSTFGVRSVEDISRGVRNNYQLTKAPNYGNDLAPNTEEDVFFPVPCEMGASSNIINHRYSSDGDPTSSTNLGDEFLMQCIGVPENHEFVSFSVQNSGFLTASPSMYNPDIMISEDECYRVIFPDAEMDGYVPPNLREGSNIDDFNGHSGSLLQAEDYHNPDPSGSDMLGTTCYQPFPAPEQLFAHERTVFISSNFYEFNDISHQNGDIESTKGPDDGILFHSNSIKSPCQNYERNNVAEDVLDDGNDSSNLVPVEISNLGSLSNSQSFTMRHDLDHSNDSMKLVSDDVLGSMPSSSIQTRSEVQSFTPTSDKNDSGSLFYEPPRFPSLDIPFFNCDLIQAGDHMQQEYSPLGIRQIMMSSMSCFSPIRLWDSPKHEGNAEAMLKSAAKTFTGTLSILKKRNRDCVSPMSDKRSEKKLESGMDRVLLSNLARNFSRRDVMFSESENSKVPPTSLSSHTKDKMIDLSYDKENMNHVKKNSPKVNEKKISEDVKTGRSAFNSKSESDSDAMTKAVPQSLGVLGEHDMNDMLFFSPERSENKSGNVSYVKHCTEKCDSKSNQDLLPDLSLRSPRLPVVVPPIGSKENNKSQLDGALPSQCSHALDPPEVMARSNDDCAENSTIFVKTPYKRSFDSPSAWKSPWFMNSFIPGPRVDTDITVEDIGYFFSPGDRSLDALGLMKQLSEQSATALADAQKVLGDETPETFLKCRRSIVRKRDKDCSDDTRNQHSTQSLVENVMIEKRVLDFSDCGTPGICKNSKVSTSKGDSSPSSYLLKGCR